jgi:Family of unknown function (DUF5956)
VTTPYDWGLDQAARSAADTAEEIDPAAHLSAEQLPEVRRLLADGWTLAPDAPMFAFLPAVWPADRRTWVPDRSAHVEQRSVVTATTGRVRAHHTVPVSPAARAEAEDDVDALLAEAGITGRPRGRLWLLKPPPGYASVDAVLDEVGRRAAAAGLGGELTAAYVRLTTEVLDSAR